MKSIKCIVPQQAGWIEVELDDDEIDFLWKSIENRGRDEKPYLAGNIGSGLPTLNKHPYFLQTMWVNYQKQTEFNPTHLHKGVYSFVIWMQIPTEYNEQKENPIAKNTNSDVISNFSFDYRDIIGEYRYHTYIMSKKMEGKMVFFPSKLTHTVYPFYNCSEDRISISGNICLDTNRII